MKDAKAQRWARGAIKNSTLERIRSFMPVRPYLQKKMAASPPTYTSGTTATITDQVIPAGFQQTGSHVSINNNNFTYYRAPNPSNSSAAVKAFYKTTVSGTLRGNLAVAFYHTGQNIELIIPGNATGGTGGGTSFLIRVDDEHILATPETPPNDSTNRYYKLAFSSRLRRRIEISSVIYFNGVNVEANDTVEPADIRGPRVVVMGDSFTSGSGGNSGIWNTWTQILSETLGWDDIINVGLGGEGIDVAGSGSTLLPIDRFPADVAAWKPDIVIFAYGRNGGTFAGTTMSANYTALLNLCASSLPNAMRIVIGPMWACGPAGWDANVGATHDVMKAVAAATGSYFVDPLMRPMPSTLPAITTVTGGSITVGARTFILVNNTDPVLPIPCTVKIDNEYVYIKSGSGNTMTIDGTFASAHSSGATVTQVGSNIFTGNGSLSGPRNWVGTASISGTTMTVTATTSGSLAIGMTIYGAGITPGTVIIPGGTYTTGAGTGTLLVSASQTVASETMTSNYFGNATLLRYSDDIHPTADGQFLIEGEIRRQLYSLLLPLRH